MLSKYSETWKNAEERRDSDIIDPPAGRYRVRVQSAGYSEVKGKDGLDYDRFFWKLCILDGEYAGACFMRTEFLPPNPADAAIKLSYIKGAIASCNVCPPIEVVDLPAALKLCENAEIEAVVVDIGRTDRSGKPIKNIKFIALQESQAAPIDNGSQIQPEPPHAPSPAPMQAPAPSRAPYRQGGAWNPMAYNSPEVPPSEIPF